MKLIICIFLFFPFCCIGQNNAFEFPRDTSYTTRSAYKKIVKEFSQARLVDEFDIPEIKEERNLVYYKLGERNLCMDVFYSESIESKKPLVLMIHGGGWASGTKSHLVPLAQKLAEKGFVTATVEYRLSPEALYPAGVTDLKTALKWLKFNEKKFSIDTCKVAVLGTSAGATLATLLGTTVGNSKFSSHPTVVEANDRVHAIINIDGVVDFTDPNESGKDINPGKPSAGARWFGATYKQNPKLWVEASPISYVDENTPPSLFINSALPRFHAGRDVYFEVLHKNNIYHEVHTIHNTPHPFWLCHPWFNEVVTNVSEFLNVVF